MTCGRECVDADGDGVGSGDLGANGGSGGFVRCGGGGGGGEGCVDEEEEGRGCARGGMYGRSFGCIMGEGGAEEGTVGDSQALRCGW